MDTMEEQEEPEENESESVAPKGQGYLICISVYPDGFTVEGPKPLPQEVDEEAERVPQLADALKHVVAITKENPVLTDEDLQFDAGYRGGE